MFSGANAMVAGFMWLSILFDVALTGWLVRGVYQMWSQRRTKWVTLIFGSLMLTGIVLHLFKTDHEAIGLALTGFWVMGALFLISIRLIRMAPQIIAIAPLIFGWLGLTEFGMEGMVLWMGLLIVIALSAAFIVVLRSSREVAGYIALALIGGALFWRMVIFVFVADRADWMDMVSTGLTVACAIPLVSMALMLPGTIVGLARITIDEAIRLRTGVLFMLIMIVMLPLLPHLMSSGEKIEYRMQFFLTWSLIITSVFLSFMTIFLACGTITQDIKKKQIFMTMVKPISRFEYLTGRWIGLSLINLMLMIIAGCGIYVFAMVVEAGPDQGMMDRARVNNEVLVARQSLGPVHPSADFLGNQFDERLKNLRAMNPDYWGEEGDALRPDQMGRINAIVYQDWHTVRPVQSQVFVFGGLENASEYGDYVVLRYKPSLGKPSPDRLVKFLVEINGRPWPVRRVMSQGRYLYRGVQQQVPDKQVATMEIPVWMIEKETGELRIRVINVDPRGPQYTWPASITFTPGEDFELLYRVGRFTPNYIRTLLILWVKLLFLTMLGLMAGTFLGFHVATLLSILIWLVAAGTGFINEALENYQQLEITNEAFFDKIVITFRTFFDRDNWFSSLRVVIRAAGHIVVAFFPSFADYDPVPLVSKGKLVPWGMVTRSLSNIGLYYSGVTALIAWFVFRRRELAKITV